MFLQNFWLSPISGQYRLLSHHKPFCLHNIENGTAFAVYLLPVCARDLLRHLYSPEDAIAAVHEPISVAA